MPRILNIFRSNKSSSSHEKKEQNKHTRSAKGSGVFRRSAIHDNGNSSSKMEIKRSSAPVPIEQTLTWTMTDDSVADSASPVKANEAEVPLLLQVENTPDWEEELLFAKPEQTEKTLVFKEEKTFVFTEDDLKQNELNHMRILAKLQSEIQSLKSANQSLSKKHAAEIAKKEDEYVELLIQLRAKEQELAHVRDELIDSKEELKVVSCTLIQTQHEKFEESNKNQWMSVFGSSFGTF